MKETVLAGREGKGDRGQKLMLVNRGWEDSSSGSSELT